MSERGGRAAVFALCTLIAGIGVWYLWSNEGHAHGTTLADTVFGDISWNPYAWWQAHDGQQAAYQHLFPDTIAPNCSRTPFANEQGTLSVTAIQAGEEVYG